MVTHFLREDNDEGGRRPGYRGGATLWQRCRNDQPPRLTAAAVVTVRGMKIRDGLEIDGERLADICRRHSVVELSLFGSALTDDFGPDSDIDLLYVFAPDARVGWNGIYELDRELSELFGHQVDLVPKRYLSAAFARGVLGEAEQLYAA